MPRRTCDASSVHPSYGVSLRQAIVQFLPHSGLALMSDDQKLRWVPRMVVICAILMSWDLADALCDSFEHARSIVVGMYPSRRRPGDSYIGFMAILRRWSGTYLSVLLPYLRKQVQNLAQERSCWRIGKWLVFGVDGSRIECPMSDANERAFGTAGKSKTGPQQFLTSVFHVASGLIWDFRRGDARSSERGHLLEMLDTLPEDAMLLADAGFTGYEFLSRIIKSGRSFLVRVGSGVRLLKKLGWCVDEHEGIVYLWPQQLRAEGQLPLALRLISLRDGRNREIHLLSSVLDETELSDGEALALYRRRWGIELIYRSLKQTMGRRKMRCESPENAAVELDWAVVGLWLLGLMSLQRILETKVSARQWSVALSLRAVRRAMCNASACGRCRASLEQALSKATKDCYHRTSSKKARHWPHKKSEKPPGAPRARMATALEVQTAAGLKRMKTAA